MARRYALVIGVSEYAFFQPLSKTASDAKAVADFLRDYGQFQEVRTRIEHKSLIGTVTKQELEQAFQTFLLEQAKGQDALIYFTGHAITVKDVGPFLVTSDSKATTVEAGEFDCFPLTKLNELINQGKPSSLIVLLDCCHSGQLLEGTLLRQTFDVWSQESRDYYFITASRGFEEARAKKSEDHSVFTKALLEGLSSKNARWDGVVSSDRLFDYIDGTLKGSGQEPKRSGLGVSIPIVFHPIDQIPLSQAGASQPHTFEPSNPYVGLAAFDARTRKYFCGRAQAVRELLARLAPPRRFLAVIGPSGCGKSSLVKAGLLPELQAGRLPDSDQWVIESLNPGEYPKDALAAVSRRYPASKQPLVLFIDQFEELFTLCASERQRQEFIQLLAHLVTNVDRHTRVVVTMRGDFLDRCAKYEQLSELINRTQPTTYIVTPLSFSELEEAIQEPAFLNGVAFEEGLVNQIAQEVIDLEKPLPLLQYALTQFWQAHIQADVRTLTKQDYRQAIGSVKNALEQQAEDLYQSFEPEEQTLIPKLMLTMVQINEGEKETRRPARLSELPAAQFPDPPLKRIIKRLADQRLLVVGEETVEIAHEALLTEWSRLQGWIAENREVIRLRDDLKRDCQDWQNNDRSDGYLLPVGKLAAIETLVKQAKLNLDSNEVEFFQRSLQKRDREIRFYRRNAIGAIAASLCIAGIATLAGVQWRAAEKGQIEALATSSQAKFNVNRNTFDALIDASRASRHLQQSIWFRNDPQLRTQLTEILGQSIYWVKERNRLEGHDNMVHSASFSSDGQTIATASYDKTVKLWSIDGKELRRLEGHTEPVMKVVFNQNGLLATASLDQTARLWNRDGTPLATLKGHTDEVRSVNFSPDGQMVATASQDGTARLWDLKGNPLEILEGHTQPVYSVSFSPDGQMIATGSGDRTVRLWDRKGRSVGTLAGFTKPISSVTFSPNGQLIAVASDDRTVSLWDRQTKTRKLPLQRHAAEVNDVNFSPDGQIIATASSDNTIKLWDLQGSQLETLYGHGSRVNSISFSPDSKQLISSSNDNTARLWQLDSGLTVLPGHTAKAYSVSFSPDGSLVASASDDSTVRVWNRNGKLLARLQGKSPFAKLSFSPDSQIIAATGFNGAVQLWTRNGQPLNQLKGHNDVATGVAFDRDGKVIATASFDKTVRFWSRAGKPSAAMTAHDKQISAIQFSPDGQTLATASYDHTVKLWNRDRTLRHIIKTDSTVYTIGFSPDSQILATAGEDNKVRLWKQGGTPLRVLEGHTAAIWGLSFRQDGQMLATASDDRTVKLWTLNGQLITTLTGFEQPVSSASFSPDGTVLATAGEDGRILLWNVENINFENLIVRTCNWLGDYLRNNPKAPREVCSNGN